MAEKNTYDADSISVHEGREGIRRRPGMYIGGRDSEALQHILWEAIDNAVDEHMAGFCDHIKITFLENGGISVEDSGRGIPPGINSKTKRSALQMVFDVHSGGKFDQKSYAQSGGLNGVGIAALAACSKRVTCDVYQNNKKHTVEFHEGKEVKFQGEGPDAKFVKSKTITVVKDPRTAAQKKERPTGTTITFWPDYTIFENGEDEDVPRAEIDINEVLSRCSTKAYLCANLEIIVEDEAQGINERFYAPDGIMDLWRAKLTAPELSHIKFADTEEITSGGVKKNLTVDMVVGWENSNHSNTSSFVNIIDTTQGGTHVLGTHKGLQEVIEEAIEDKGIKKAKDPTPELDDILEGINLVVSVRLPEPDYAGQTKQRLRETSVTRAIQRVVKRQLEPWFKSRTNAAEAKKVLEKILDAARTRVRRSAKFNISEVMAETDKSRVFGAKPERLRDCRKVKDPMSSLMLVEGDSALGTLQQARDADYQALYPLKGKPLNVFGLSPERLYIPAHHPAPKTPAEKRKDKQRKAFLDAGHILLQNKELDGLVRAIGAGFGDTFNIEECRYHDIILVADADVDGAHITVLLIGFFATYMRPLIEHGRLLLAMPSLYIIKTGTEANPVLHYAANDEERNQIINKLKKDKVKILEVARRKGHGEASVEEMQDQIMNPETRSLKRVTIESATEAMEMLNLTLGNDASLRKEWITRPETSELVTLESLA